MQANWVWSSVNLRYVLQVLDIVCAVNIILGNVPVVDDCEVARLDVNTDGK